MGSKQLKTFILVVLASHLTHQFDDALTLGVPTSYRPSFNFGGDNYPGIPD